MDGWMDGWMEFTAVLWTSLTIYIWYHILDFWSKKAFVIRVQKGFDQDHAAIKIQHFRSGIKKI